MKKKSVTQVTSVDNRRNIIILVISALLVIAIIAFFSTSLSTKNPDSSENASTSMTIGQPTEQTPKEKLLSQLSSLIKDSKVFDAGSYAIGSIPSGEYAFIVINAGQGYYSEEEASGNIVDNENFDSFGWVFVNGSGNITTRGILVPQNIFSMLNVASAKEIYVTLNDKSLDYNQAGYYKIGVDLPAGTYTLESIGSNSYMSIESGGVGKSEIIDNDIFSGTKTVTVSNGQYLKISKAKINPA